MTPDRISHIAALPCWRGRVEVLPLGGGMTNHNFRVQDAQDCYAVRLGEDLPLHGVLRSHELVAARAAHAAGLSPEVVFAAPGVMVSRFVEGRTLVPGDLRDLACLPRVLDLVQRCHRAMPPLLPATMPVFEVFSVIRRYAAILAPIPGQLLQPRMAELLRLAQVLESTIGPSASSVFGHNDLLAGNFLDDGTRLWLIDWDYAGQNTPLFDLANLSANNGFGSREDAVLLEVYFGSARARPSREALGAMRRASMLREVFWGAVSHHHARIEFDYAGYTLDWLRRLDQDSAGTGEA